MQDFLLQPRQADIVRATVRIIRALAIASLLLIGIGIFMRWNAEVSTPLVEDTPALIFVLAGVLVGAAVLRGPTLHLHYCMGGRHVEMSTSWMSSLFVCIDCDAGSDEPSSPRLVSVPLGILNRGRVRIGGLKTAGGWRFYFFGLRIVYSPDSVGGELERLLLWMVSAEGEGSFVTLDQLFRWEAQPRSPLDCRSAEHVFARYPTGR